jgi:hypothetical protein
MQALVSAAARSVHLVTENGSSCVVLLVGGQAG